MENTAQPTRSAKRRAAQSEQKEEPTTTLKTIGISETAFAQAEKNARRFKMSKSQYASAAIAYFAQSGMNPTTEQPIGLANVETRVAREARATQAHNAEIGNRIVSIIRGWEKSSYAFHQQLQMSQNMHLELLESNILQRLVAAENNFFGPMMEQLFKGNVEGFIGRCVGERVYLKVSGQPESAWDEANDMATAERDTRTFNYLKDFASTNALEPPKATPRPVIISTPARISPPASEVLKPLIPGEKK